MKGTLHKTESGWHVINMQATLNGPLLQSLPILDHGYVNGPGLSDSDEGQEVEFEIVSNEGEPLGRGEQPYKQYAKLVDKATRPLTEDDAWPDYPTRAEQLREQAWDNVLKDCGLPNKMAVHTHELLQVLEYLKDNYNPPTKKQN